MAFQDYANKECLCTFVQVVSPIKQTILGAVNSAIASLALAKALIQLVPLSVEDQLKKVALETALDLEKQAANVAIAPITVLNSIVRPYSDCPPVANVSKVIKNAKDLVLSDLNELEYQVQLYIDQLENERLKVEQIDRWISSLNDFKDALDMCGDA